MPEPLNQQIDRLQEIFFSEKDPTGRAFVPLADAHRRLGELDRALGVLQEGLVAHPDSASGHVVEGWLYRDRGEDDSAIRALERVLELDAENGVALRSLAELVEDASRGLTYIERLVELEPDDPEVLAALESLRAEVAEASTVAGTEAVAPEEPVVEDALAEAVPVEDAAPLETAKVSAPDEVALEEPATEAEPADEVGLEEPVAEAEPPSEGVAEDVAEDDGEIYTQTLAELYAKQGAVDKAVEVYRKLLADDPDNGMFLHRVAELTWAIDTGLADDRPVVPIESLAPDPDPAEAVVPEPAVPVEDLPPDPEPLVVEPPAADPEPVGSLAMEDASSVDDDRPVVPIESLAPEGPSDGETDDGGPDDPFPWLNRL